ncbi:NADPH:quinone reductase-like Zn-dependent oxidoreductase [Erwinia toletana]|uniref:NADPH:quinone reductase-like Zn-dependent oxidoreductase n=1 Tax=Winslowiella toletana TaxID=92490 RepID=A0ABS4P365_9GAMM|nr:zinc-binding dehydrogenase [Winslowiella toletana]MBP2167106.1 NADPH:quinone reductase-like Zn-dependent oxidoreductase [Winslowiella toletana]
MKAIIYDQPGEPEVLRLEDVADPTPADTELLIRVEAISIEGGDLVGRRYRAGGADAILGYAAAGEVLQVGKAVEGFAVGQKVTTFYWTGSHAELRVVPATNCFVVPPGLDMRIAAAIPVGPGTAAWALQLGALQRGQTVLILGAAGGVGIAAVQLAAKMGARVIGTGTSLASLEKLRQYGLTDAIVTGSRTASAQLRDLLGGNAVDLLIDNIGGPELSDGIEALREGGRAVLIGVLAGRNQPIDAGHLLMHRKTVIGCLFGPEMGDPQPRALVADLLEKALHGELQLPIDATFPLSEAAAAHRRAEERGRIGRVFITV